MKTHDTNYDDSVEESVLTSPIVQQIKLYQNFLTSPWTPSYYLLILLVEPQNELNSELEKEIENTIEQEKNYR